MKYIFILGLGRSGTSWVSRTLAQSSSPLIYFEEPLTKLKEYPYNSNEEKWSVSANGSEKDIKFYKDTFKLFEYTTDRISEDVSGRCVFANNQFPNFIIIKEVHNLAVFHRLVEDLDYKAIIVYRDPLRILDSYFYNFNKRMNYRDEYLWLQKAVKHPNEIRDEKYKYLLQFLGDPIIDYLKRPFEDTEEYVRFFITILFNQIMLHRFDKNRKIPVSYKALCYNPKMIFEELCKSIGLEFGKNMLDFINDCSEDDDRQDPYSIRRTNYLLGKEKYKYLSDEQLQVLSEFSNGIDMGVL